MEKTRLNITITKDMKDYIEEVSKEIGISQNALINLMISKYIKNNPSS
ncbi:hypothetical protein GNF86_14895 [Clostridium perfringens]|jgi:antitoxin component of RelBE/YafQ-DinJ toxin-antitoxin module